MAAPGRRPRSLAYRSRETLASLASPFRPARHAPCVLARLALRAHASVLMLMGSGLRPPLAGWRRGMDFGLTDDQRDIQRTARDLLAERATFARVREHAEAGTTDTALWNELCELGWPGIALSASNGGQGLGTIELSIL